MKSAHGVFNGTGAAVFICCGFQPDEVWVWGVGDATANIRPRAYWNKLHVATESLNGVMMPGDAAWSDFTAGNGIEPYEGGEMLTAALQTSTGYGEGVYLAHHAGINRDWRYNVNNTPLAGEAASSNIDTWTLDTSANRSGKFNEDVDANATHIGEGSQIIIANDSRLKRYQLVWIESVTAGTGEADDEVVLSRAIPSGVVEYIGPRYTVSPLAVDALTPPGFKLNITTPLNVNDELQGFRAVQW